MRLRAVCVSVLLAMAAVSASAKPNLSGDWKLNLSKSDYGPMPAPNSMVQKITHEEPKLKVEMKQSSDCGDVAWEANYTTDGKESKNSIRDNPFVSILKWDGDTLVSETKGKFNDNEFTLTDKWTLSEDGKMLTISRHISSGFGEGDQKLVFEKQ